MNQDYLSSLRRNALIVVEGSHVRASDTLFLALKRSYFDIAVRYLRDLEEQMAQPTLFDLLVQAEETAS